MRFTMLGLTASGGMLDLRFVAVDADKVEQLGHHGTKIRLVVERTGHTLNSEQMTPHFGKIHVGSQYFALLRNDGNALIAKPATMDRQRASRIAARSSDILRSGTARL